MSGRKAIEAAAREELCEPGRKTEPTRRRCEAFDAIVAALRPLSRHERHRVLSVVQSYLVTLDTWEGNGA